MYQSICSNLRTLKSSIMHFVNDIFFLWKKDIKITFQIGFLLILFI